MCWLSIALTVGGCEGAATGAASPPQLPDPSGPVAAPAPAPEVAPPASATASDPAPLGSTTAQPIASSASAPGLSPTCTLPLVTGSCKAAFRVFGFDAAKGACVPFTYGGCGGNANRFETLEACQRACR